MQSVITSEFNTIIPKVIREKLKLSVNDTLEWKIEDRKIIVFPTRSSFLKYQNAVKIGKGDISEDIQKVRNIRAEKYS